MSDTGRIGWVGIDRHWLSDPNLTDSDLRLMLWLTSHTEEFRSKLHVKACAEQIGWSRDRVKRSLVSLESLGLITTEIADDHASGARTKISIHQDIWSDRCATPRGRAVPRDEAQAVPHGKAPSNSTSNVEESNSGERPSDTTPEALFLCNLMAELIEARGAKRPTVTKAWLTDMDRLMRLDNRNPMQAERVIRWLYSDADSIAQFWSPNVRSPAKLRERWDQMAEQYARLPKANAPKKSMAEQAIDAIRNRDLR